MIATIVAMIWAIFGEGDMGLSLTPSCKLDQACRFAEVITICRSPMDPRLSSPTSLMPETCITEKNQLQNTCSGVFKDINQSYSERVEYYKKLVNLRGGIMALVTGKYENTSRVEIRERLSGGEIIPVNEACNSY